MAEELDDVQPENDQDPGEDQGNLDGTDTDGQDDADDGDGAGDGEPDQSTAQAASPQSPRELGLPYDDWSEVAKGYKHMQSAYTQAQQRAIEANMQQIAALEQQTRAQQPVEKTEAELLYEEAVTEYGHDSFPAKLARVEVERERNERAARTATAQEQAQQVYGVLHQFGHQYQALFNDPEKRGHFIDDINDRMGGDFDFVRLVNQVSAGVMPAGVDPKTLVRKLNMSLRAVGEVTAKQERKESANKTAAERAGATPAGGSSRPAASPGKPASLPGRSWKDKVTSVRGF